MLSTLPKDSLDVKTILQTNKSLALLYEKIPKPEKLFYCSSLLIFSRYLYEFRPHMEKSDGIYLEQIGKDGWIHLHPQSLSFEYKCDDILRWFQENTTYCLTFIATATILPGTVYEWTNNLFKIQNV